MRGRLRFVFFIVVFCLIKTLLLVANWTQSQECVFDLDYEIIEDRSSSLNDSKGRKMLKIALPNGLQALLISDPSLTESAASVSIEVGTWDDPVEHPGMAHFIEHLLFLGTQKYPKESDFSKYILERGGQYNAFTKHDRTNYGFSINNSSFEGALDRLSHFFIDPLFSSDSIAREVYAVHHEFEDSIENDSLRVWRILKESGNQKHPNVKFSCGNLHSLAHIKRSDVVNWFESHYNPKKMKLVLASQESLETLADLASRFFSPISREKESSCTHKIGHEASLLTSDQKGHFIHIKPSFKNRSLFFIWEVPQLFLQHQNSSAVQLVEMALDHGYSNSLSHILEKEGLGVEVHVDFWKIEKKHALFMLNVVLTDTGMAQYEKVILTVFQAINRLKLLEFPAHLVNKLRYLNDVKFYSSFESTFDYVMRVSSELIDEDTETYPDHTTLLPADAQFRASSFLQELNSADCLYCLIASPEEAKVKMTRIEKWMGAEYLLRKISEETLQKWNTAVPHASIGFEPEEELLPKEKDIPLVETEVPEEEAPDPFFIVDEEKARIRLIDTGVEEDFVEAFFCLSTSSVGHSAKNTALSEIFFRSIEGLLHLEFAADDSVFWDLEMGEADFCLFIRVPTQGFSDNFQRFFRVLKSSIITGAEFEKLKKMQLDNYPGDPQPIDYARQILDSFLRPFHYTKMELYHNLSTVSYEEYQVFQKSYFDQIFVEGAFLSFLKEKEALDVWQKICLILDLEAQKPYEAKSKQFSFQEEDQSYFILQKTHRKGNALLLLIAADESSVKKEVIHKIITRVLHNEFFEELRTKQQTAYRLYTWNEFINQQICYSFALQSSTHQPLDLLKRVEDFLDFLLEDLDQIFTFERFDLIRNTLVRGWLKQRGEIDKPEDVAFIEGEMSTLIDLTYEEVLAAMRQVFSKNNRRRIAVLVEGSLSDPILKDGFYGVPYLPINKEKFHR